jgi:hypothetical protein
MKPKYLYSYSAALVLFLGLFILLCWYFRISTDDFFYLSEVQRIGIFKTVYNYYFKWSGRYATFTVQSIIFKILYNHIAYFFLFPLLSFILFVWGIYKNMEQLSLHCNFAISAFTRWVLSLSFIALLFFLSVDIGENWFWCSCISCYLFSIIAVTWGIFFIVHPAGNLFHYSAICGCFIFIGGSCEVYAPVFLIILAFLLYMRYRQSLSFSVFIQHTIHKKLLTAFIFMSISYFLLLIAPGNFCRDQLFPKHQFLFSFFITAKSLVKFFILFVPSHLHYLLAFSTVFYITGNDFKENCQCTFKMEFVEFVKKTSLFFLLFVLFYFYMVAYIMSETGPARIWFLVSFVFCVWCCSVSFYAGYHQLLSSKKVSVLKKMSVATAFFILSYSIICQSEIAKRYAAAYDERANVLTELNKCVHKDTVVVIPALPPPGMLYGAEISGDTAHYTNQHLRMGYKLTFHVIKN